MPALTLRYDDMATTPPDADWSPLLIKVAGIVGAIWGLIYSVPKICAALVNGLDVLKRLANIQTTTNEIQRHLRAQDETADARENAKAIQFLKIENEQVTLRKMFAKAELEMEGKFARLLSHHIRGTLTHSALAHDAERLAGIQHEKDKAEADRRGISIEDLHLERTRELERLAEIDEAGKPERDAAVAKFKVENPLPKRK